MLARTVTESTDAHQRHSHRQQSTRGRERHHRGTDRRRADQIRDGQVTWWSTGSWIPMRQLRLRAAHALGRRRSSSHFRSLVEHRSFPKTATHFSGSCSSVEQSAQSSPKQPRSGRAFQLRMREQPQLSVKGRWAALTPSLVSREVAVGDNARQERSTKPGDHSFEDGFCIVHAHGGNSSIVSGGGSGNPPCLR